MTYSVRHLVIVLSLVFIATEATATPNAGSWRRQTLVGENPGFFFRYVTTSEYPPSYYSFRRTLRIEKVRKSDLRVIEQFPLRDVAYSQDMDTGVWNERSETVPPFDLAGYLTRNEVHVPFSEDLFRFRTFAIDSAGVWEVFEDGRVELAGRSDLLQQIPDLGDEPCVAGIERTDLEPVKGEKAFIYLRVWSNSASGDDNWSEDLLLVNRLVLH